MKIPAKKRLVIISIVALILLGGATTLLLSQKTSSAGTDTQAQSLSKSTTADGFLMTTIGLVNDDTLHMQRTPEGIVEYLVPSDGQWVPYARFQASDLIDVHVSVQVLYDETTELYTYTYIVSSSPNSRQKVQTFGFQLDGAEGFEPTYPYNFSDIFEVSPDEWSFVNSTDTNIWRWTCLPPYGITPGASEGRFSFKSPCPPGISTCFALGESELYTWVDGGDTYPFPEWYDQGVKGRTVGPVPEEPGRSELADRLLGYLPVCVVEEWMNAYVETYLSEQLQAVKSDFEQGNFPDARTRLEQCIEYLAGRSDSELANEARLTFDLNLRLLRSLT